MNEKLYNDLVDYIVRNVALGLLDKKDEKMLYAVAAELAKEKK